MIELVQNAHGRGRMGPKSGCSGDNFIIG
jgi:hypothetical protein